jgi:hypothetical protein
LDIRDNTTGAGERVRSGRDSLMEIVSMKERNHLENLEINRRIILKLIIRKMIVSFPDGCKCFTTVSNGGTVYT